MLYRNTGAWERKGKIKERGHPGREAFQERAPISVNNYADTCQHSQQLNGHCVSVVNVYAVTQCACSRSRWLRGQGVVVVNNYTDTFGKLWRLFTDFKGTIRKKVLRCVYTSNNNTLNLWKTLRSNISAKTKNFANRFRLFIWSNLWSKKKCQKSSDAVPFKGVNAF